MSKKYAYGYSIACRRKNQESLNVRGWGRIGWKKCKCVIKDDGNPIAFLFLTMSLIFGGRQLSA